MFEDLEDLEDDVAEAEYIPSWKDTFHWELSDSPCELADRLHEAEDDPSPDDILEVARLYCDSTVPDVHVFSTFHEGWVLAPTVTGPWRRRCWRPDEALFRTRRVDGTYLWEPVEWVEDQGYGFPSGWQAPQYDGLGNLYR